MNKKVSTLLTCGLMLGGSLLCSSAFAQGNLVGTQVSATDFENNLDKNPTYFIMSSGEVALGMSDLDLVNQTTSYQGVYKNNISDDIDEADNFMWKVTESLRVVDDPNGGKVYTLTNVGTGKQLLIKSDKSGLLTDYSDTSKAADPSYFNFASYADYAPSTVLYALNTATSALIINNTTGAVSLGSSSDGISFYTVKDQDIEADDLNKLYNSIGFNFELSDDEIANIFDQEGVRVRAIEVNVSGYSGIKFNENGERDNNGDYEFPNGTYFVIETPAGEVPTDLQDKLDYLLQCTFIAVSSSENVSQDADKQKAGEGFTLTTVSGADLVTYNVTSSSAQASKLPNHDQISVHNACFDVALQPTSSKYALTLPQFRYQAASGSETQTIKTNVQLVLSDDRYGATEYLCTYPTTTPSYIFTFVEANAVNPITEFLNADGQAAIYNIQFVSGENDDKDEIGKYLFAPAYEKELYAKGEALTDTDMPEFQFIITNVNGNNVTFTNRANNNVKFTAKFFAEGDGSYIMADAKKSGELTDFAILNINEDGDVVKVDDKDLNATVVKLTAPASTDKFNGTWNVEDGSEVTISFARDADPTSNKLYPVVDENYAFTNPTDEVYEGAHWQLVKSDKPGYLTRMYAYRVGEGDKATVSFKNATDTTAYYTYKFQLVVDGDVVEQYLKKAGTIGLTANEDDVDDATSFVIKDNVDGSVAIIEADYDEKYHVAFSKYDNVKNDLEDFLKDSNATPQLVALDNAKLSETSKAGYIKTYLVPEAPEISWQTEGHVTLQSERGNYISLDENNDAIVVTEAEEVYYLNKTDKDAIIPSYYITRGTADGSTAESSRLYMFNPTDSVDYYMGAGKYDKEYQWREETTKVIFKAGQLNAAADTLTTDIKGKATKVAMKADNKGTEGGLNRFKFQIVETEDGDGLYYIRQIGATGGHGDLAGNYLASNNEQLTWSKRAQAMKFALAETSAPTANEGVSATDVKVIAVDGAINIKNAAGKNVVVSTILGQIVANEVLTSDNATISVPAGIAIVSVDGEEAVKVSVR